MSGVVALVGPTAVGKSRLALELACSLDAEIISADSRQVYRYMDIGTAKPSAHDRSLVPHHFIDIVDPDEEFNVALYREQAITAIQNVLSRGNIPFLVGGTGLYVKAVTGELFLPKVPPNHEFRRRLEERAAAEGCEVLWRELHQIDPQRASQIDHHNPRRVIRALEVWEATGRPPSEFRNGGGPPFSVLFIGLTMERGELYRRIDRRVDQMMEDGLLDEVKGLVAKGYGWDLPSMSGLGYRQIGAYLRGECSLDEAVARIKTQTHRFVRQQYTWFRLDDPKIRWFDAQEIDILDITRYIHDFLKAQRDGAEIAIK